MKEEISLSLNGLDNSNIAYITSILEKIGHISVDFDASPIVGLLTHFSPEVRVLAIKNLAKIKNDIYIQKFIEIYENDTSSIVRREAVSAIGRQRNKKNIPFFIRVLSDNDPKIACQAIRALLIFKGERLIDETLKLLINHENEMIKAVISKEYYAQKTDKNTKPHSFVPEQLKDVIVLGDVKDVLKTIKEESFHLTFTSPPYYNARDYSTYESYEAYLSFLETVFKEVYRTTKEGRFLIVNTSPVIVPRISRTHSSKRYPIPFDLHTILIKQGWEFIDDIVWEKPEYSVKNRIGGFQQHRKPLAYKPNSVTEYLMVYRKKTDKLLDWNIHQYDNDTIKSSKVSDGFFTTNVWKICPKSDKVHSAIFPIELCQKVIEYYSYKGDLIFDPFAGSGTLGRTAKSMDRKFFLTEKEPKYFEYMKSFLDVESLLEENHTKFMTLDEFKAKQGE
ncbi:MAG: HEAT repeat domain-containing protein [Clostridiales bacterium]|nr:HEAT repeat domain-containing protein [Clostridiales bacterium]